MLTLEECSWSRFWCGFLGYDALVVLPALVLMEIPSASENWLRSAEL